MKVLLLAVCLSLLVASQAFILNDGFRELMMFNTLSGRSPFDFSSLLGGGANPAGQTTDPNAVDPTGAGSLGLTGGRSSNPLSSLFGMTMMGDMGFF